MSGCVPHRVLSPPDALAELQHGALASGRRTDGPGRRPLHVQAHAYALRASLSVLLDARQHIKDYPTQAEDAGTSTRTTQHFLQRVLNSTTAELAPTQAAAIVLGMPSAAHSHTFVVAR